MDNKDQEGVLSSFVTRIEPPNAWKPLDWPEVWRFRELFLILVWRDIRVLFSRTVLGFLWVVLSPLSMVLVLTIVLGILVKVPTGGVPYPLVLLSGLVPWLYFNSTVTKACSSMVTNAYLLTKVYLPRILIPAVPLAASLVDFAILLAVLLVMTVLFGIRPVGTWLFLPVPVFITIGLSCGISLALSALNVKHRDIAYVLPVILQILMYASPLFYPLSLIPPRFRVVYSLNPFVGVCEGMRWALFAKEQFPTFPLMVSLVAMAVLLLAGVLIFKRVEDSIADIV